MRAAAAAVALAAMAALFGASGAEAQVYTAVQTLRTFEANNTAYLGSRATAVGIWGDKTCAASAGQAGLPGLKLDKNSGPASSLPLPSLVSPGAPGSLSPGFLTCYTRTSGANSPVDIGTVVLAGMPEDTVSVTAIEFDSWGSSVFVLGTFSSTQNRQGFSIAGMQVNGSYAGYVEYTFVAKFAVGASSVMPQWVKPMNQLLNMPSVTYDDQLTSLSVTDIKGDMVVVVGGVLAQDLVVSGGGLPVMTQRAASRSAMALVLRGATGWVEGAWMTSSADPAATLSDSKLTSVKAVAHTGPNGDELRVLVGGSVAPSYSGPKFVELGPTTGVPASEVRLEWFSDSPAGETPFFGLLSFDFSAASNPSAAVPRTYSAVWGQQVRNTTMNEMNAEGAVLSLSTATVAAASNPLGGNRVAVVGGRWRAPLLRFGPPADANHVPGREIIFDINQDVSVHRIMQRRRSANEFFFPAAFLAGFDFETGAPLWLQLVDVPANFVGGSQGPEVTQLAAPAQADRVMAAVTVYGRTSVFGTSASMAVAPSDPSALPSGSTWLVNPRVVNNTAFPPGSSDYYTPSVALVGFKASTGQIEGDLEIVSGGENHAVAVTGLAATPATSTVSPGATVFSGKFDGHIRFGDLSGTSTDNSWVPGALVVGTVAANLETGFVASADPFGGAVTSAPGSDDDVGSYGPTDDFYSPGGGGTDDNTPLPPRPVPQLPPGLQLRLPTALEQQKLRSPREVARHGGLVLGYVMLPPGDGSGVAIDASAVGPARVQARAEDRPLKRFSQVISDADGAIDVPPSPVVDAKAPRTDIDYSTSAWFTLRPSDGALILKEDAPELQPYQNHHIPIRITPVEGRPAPSDGTVRGGQIQAEISVSLMCTGDRGVNPLGGQIANFRSAFKVVVVVPKVGGPLETQVEARNGGGSLPWRDLRAVTSLDVNLLRNIIADRLGLLEGTSGSPGSYDDPYNSYNPPADDPYNPPIDDPYSPPTDDTVPSANPSPLPSANPSPFPTSSVLPSAAPSGGVRRLQTTPGPSPSVAPPGGNGSDPSFSPAPPAGNGSEPTVSPAPTNTPPAPAPPAPALRVRLVNVTVGVPEALARAGSVGVEGGAAARFAAEREAHEYLFHAEFSTYVPLGQKVRPGANITIDLSQAVIPDETFQLSSDGTPRRVPNTNSSAPAWSLADSDDSNLRGMAIEELHNNIASAVLRAHNLDPFWASRRRCQAASFVPSTGRNNQRPPAL